jgi:uncharacterized protein
MLTFVTNRLGQISLVAAKRFRKGEVVFNLNFGEFFDRPSLRTIELAPKLHVDNPWGRYTNHHCDPTCYVDRKDKVMRASRDIEVGEEINFDYFVNESTLATSFNCHCGAPQCRGFIGNPDSQPSHLQVNKKRRAG